jgi:hypothetical protein
MIYRLLISWPWLLCIFLWFWARLIRVGLPRTHEGMSETPARWGKPWLGVSIFFHHRIFFCGPTASAAMMMGKRRLIW